MFEPFALGRKCHKGKLVIMEGVATAQNSSKDTNNQAKKAPKKKRNRKNSKENSVESLKTKSTIKVFFKEECKKDSDASTPTSAKKRSPPSATKPQSKRMNLNETESSDSEMDSSSDEETAVNQDQNQNQDHNQVKLSPELILLKNVLRTEIKTEMDNSIDNKLEPLQNSLNSLVAKSSTSPTPQVISQIAKDALSLKIKCIKAEQENIELKSRVRFLEQTLKENSLVFTGLRESPWEQPATTFEKIYRTLSNTMTGSNKDRLEKAKKIGIINAT